MTIVPLSPSGPWPERGEGWGEGQLGNERVGQKRAQSKRPPLTLTLAP